MEIIPSRLFPMGVKASAAPLPPTETFTLNATHSTSRAFDVVTDTDLAANAGSASVRSHCTVFWVNNAGTWDRYWFKGNSQEWRTWGGVTVDSIPIAPNQEFYATPSDTFAEGVTTFTVNFEKRYVLDGLVGW